MSFYDYLFAIGLKPSEERSDTDKKELIKFMSTINFLNEESNKSNDRDSFFSLIAESVKSEQFLKGEALFHFGQKGDKYYIILDGAVEIFIPKGENQLERVFNQPMAQRSSVTLHQSKAGRTSSIKDINSINHKIEKEIKVNKAKNDKDPNDRMAKQDKDVIDKNNNRNEHEIGADLQLDQERELNEHPDLSPNHYSWFNSYKKTPVSYFLSGRFIFTCIRTLYGGSGIGEMALKDNKKRSASAIAISDTKTMTVDKKTFSIILKHFYDRNKEKITFFRELMPEIHPKTLETVNFNIKEKFYQSNNTKIYSEGDLCDGFYIVCRGEVQILKRTLHDKEEYLNYSLGKHKQQLTNFNLFSMKFSGKHEHNYASFGILGLGRVFGLSELIDNCSKRNFTAKIHQPNTLLYFISKNDYHDIFAKQYPEVIKKFVEISKNHEQTDLNRTDLLTNLQKKEFFARNKEKLDDNILQYVKKTEYKKYEETSPDTQKDYLENKDESAKCVGIHNTNSQKDKKSFKFQLMLNSVMSSAIGIEENNNKEVQQDFFTITQPKSSKREKLQKYPSLQRSTEINTKLIESVNRKLEDYEKLVYRKNKKLQKQLQFEKKTFVQSMINGEEKDVLKNGMNIKSMNLTDTQIQIMKMNDLKIMLRNATKVQFPNYLEKQNLTHKKENLINSIYLPKNQPSFINNEEPEIINYHSNPNGKFYTKTVKRKQNSFSKANNLSTIISTQKPELILKSQSIPDLKKNFLPKMFQPSKRKTKILNKKSSDSSIKNNYYATHHQSNINLHEKACMSVSYKRDYSFDPGDKEATPKNLNIYYYNQKNLVHGQKKLPVFNCYSNVHFKNSAAVNNVSLLSQDDEIIRHIPAFSQPNKMFPQENNSKKSILSQKSLTEAVKHNRLDSIKLLSDDRKSTLISNSSILKKILKNPAKNNFLIGRKDMFQKIKSNPNKILQINTRRGLMLQKIQQ